MEVTKGRCHGQRWVRLDDPIFGARHWIFYGPAKSAQKALREVIGLDDPLVGAGACITLTAHGAVGQTAIWVESGENALTALIHEAHHATFVALEAVGVPLEGETSEVFAYYHGWLVREGRKGVGI